MSANKKMMVWFSGLIVGSIVGFIIGTWAAMYFPSKINKIDMPIGTQEGETGSYHNDFAGFSLTLPENAMFMESYNFEGGASQTLRFGKRNGVALTDLNVKMWIVDLNGMDSRTLDSWEKEDPNFGQNYSDRKNMNIGGVTARRYEVAGLYGIQEYRLISPNKKYSISIEVVEWVEDEVIQDQKDLVDAIVKTWKFDK